MNNKNKHPVTKKGRWLILKRESFFHLHRFELLKDFDSQLKAGEWIKENVAPVDYNNTYIVATEHFQTITGAGEFLL